MPLRKDGTERMRSSTHKIYLGYIQAYIEGCTMKEIAAKKCIHFESVRGAFIQMRIRYKVETTPELIAVLFRLNLLK